MKENKENLKPCPFCNSNYIKISPRYSELTGEIYWHKVECLGCYASLGCDDKYKAISKWNKRILNK